MIDRSLNLHKVASQVYAGTTYKKKFDCKNCSQWFHDKKKMFDKIPLNKGPYFMKCYECGYYNILHKSGRIKRDVDIHRKYTKYEITCLCVQMKWTVPIEFYSDEPDSDDSGMG